MSKESEFAEVKAGVNNSATPRIRFPEFVDTKPWDVIPMSEIYTFMRNNSLSRDKLNYESGTIKNIHYGDIHTKFPTHLDTAKEVIPYINESEISVVRDSGYCEESDLIFADASEDLKDVGKSIEVTKLHDSLLVAGLHTILARPLGNRIAPGFGGYLFKSNSARSQIQRESQGAKVLGISPSRLKKILLAIPPSKLEQQKIADCLSSMDELIAAQARKVEALKKHKKGLMQQLFPREGETVPRLRFEEFRGSGEWEEIRLAELSRIALSNGVFNDPKMVGSGYKLINVSDMYSDLPINESSLNRLNISSSFFEGNRVQNGDIFFTRSSLVKSGIAASNIYLGYSEDVTYDGHLIRFRPDQKKLHPLFAHYALKISRIRNQLIARGKTATMTTIGQADLADTIMPLPDLSEQEHLAKFFFNLDNFIVHFYNECEILRKLKSGLMQRLFPTAVKRYDT